MKQSMPGIDNATFFTLRSSKRCITVMVLTKLALLAHLSCHSWLVPSSALVHTQSFNNFSAHWLFLHFYSIQVGNEFLIVCGTFCDWLLGLFSEAIL